MRRTHYIRERAKLEARAGDLKIELEQVQRKIAALDIVWNEIFSQDSSHPLPADSDGPPTMEVATTEAAVTSQDDATSADAPQTDEEGASPVPGNGALGRIIDGLALHWPGDFGVRQIEGAIRSRFPLMEIDRTTIAGRLKRLAVDGRLLLVAQGKGRKGSVFRAAVMSQLTP